MATGELWTSSQRQAWGYVTQAFNEGLNQTQALTAYRAGGGAIRTAYWGELWHRQQEGESNWSTLYQYKRNDVIPESMYEPVGIDYRSQYNVVYKANIRLEDGSILHDQYRTIRSNVRLTMGEIQDAINETLRAYAGDYGVENVQVSDMKFYSPE